MGFFFLQKPQIWSLLVTANAKGDLKTPQNLLFLGVLISFLIPILECGFCY